MSIIRTQNHFYMCVRPILDDSDLNSRWQHVDG